MNEHQNMYQPLIYCHKTKWWRMYFWSHGHANLLTDTASLKGPDKSLRQPRLAELGRTPSDPPVPPRRIAAVKSLGTELNHSVPGKLASQFGVSKLTSKSLGSFRPLAPRLPEPHLEVCRPSSRIKRPERGSQPAEWRDASKVADLLPFRWEISTNTWIIIAGWVENDKFFTYNHQFGLSGQHMCKSILW